MGTVFTIWTGLFDESLGVFEVDALYSPMQRIAPQGSQRTLATCIAATTPELTVEILNSVF